MSPPHEFAANICLLYLDLDELPGPLAGRWFWGSERGLVSWRRSDHFGDPKLPMAESVRRLVEERTGARPTGPIRVLTLPRMWGYYFNPLAVFYCFSPDGERVEAIVAEVSNTPWGERHCYVLRSDSVLCSDSSLRDVDAEGAGSAIFHAGFDKAMHVSPFMPMDMNYRWTSTPPGEKLAVGLENHREGARAFDAVLHVERRPITGRTLAGAILRFPWITAQVWMAIYWQALRLWWKNARYYSHPKSAEVPATTDATTLPSNIG